MINTKMKWTILIGSLLGISIVSIFPYFLNNFIFLGDDTLFHRTRLDSYHQAVMNMDLFPRVFSNMGLNFGYGVDLFYPSILLLPFALLRIIGLDFVTSYYVYQLIISLVTAVTAYYFLINIKKSMSFALLFSCVYTLSTYRLIDQSVRVALGETLAFAFLPLFVLGIYRLFYTEENNWKLISIGMSLLIASHLITAFYSFVFLLIFLLINKRNITRKQVVNLIKSGFLTLGLSAWFLFPYIEQIAYQTFNFGSSNLWQGGLSFTLGEIVLNSLSNVSAPFSGLKPNIGLFLLLTLIISLFSIGKLSEKNKKLTFIAFFFLLISTNIFPWALFKSTIFGVIQFPWRLLLFGSFFTSLLAIQLVEHYHFTVTKKIGIAFAVIFLAFGFNINNFEQITEQNNVKTTNKNVSKFYDSELGHGKEYLIKDTDYKKYMESPYPIIDGIPYMNTWSPPVNKYNFSKYIIKNDKNIEVQLPKFYYTGYQVVDNKNRTTIYNKDGLVTLQLSPGIHTLTISYKKTLTQIFSTTLSILVLMTLIVSPIIKRNANKANK